MEWEMSMVEDAGAVMAAYYSTGSRSVPPSNTTSAYGSVIPPETSGVSYLSGSSDTNFFSAMPTEPPSSVVAGNGCFASVLQSQQQSSLDLYVPQCEDAAELEWLSQFMEDSFSDTPKEVGWSSISPPLACAEQVHAEPPATARGAQSKRFKAVAWSSSVAPSHQPGRLNSPSSSISSSYELTPSELSSFTGSGRNGRGKKGRATEEGGEARRCTHCASEKTPQWRTGPLGPKTLCNACGVRYKSGRLVPEYRPAASPTFLLAQHSNSHRKVMQLRRQKEFLLRHHQTDTSSVSRSEVLYDDGYGVS
ncbi:GATA transcription factor 4-like [Curcuma longa]|uniref:GATA transcription factor 4-like n=1 Tax=Curcuma longa TaxID=136217 RepID=UPI003D9DE1FA